MFTPALIRPAIVDNIRLFHRQKPKYNPIKFHSHGLNNITIMIRLYRAFSAMENVYKMVEKDALMAAMTQSFAPEFLNRIDEIVIFNKLKEDDIERILDLELDLIRENLLEVGKYKLRISSSAKKIIIGEGYSAKYGARQISRTLERLIENRVSEMILRGVIKDGDTISVKAKDGKIMIG